MLRWTRYLMLAAAFVTTFVMLAPDAEARRLGGGRSFGKSSGSLFKRSPSAAPKQNAAAGSAAAAGGKRSGMMGMVGGLAAGLGLAWLASSLGFGEELANIMMIMLLVGAGLFLLKFIMSRSAAARQGAGLRPAAAGAGAGSPGAPLNRDAGPAANFGGSQASGSAAPVAPAGAMAASNQTASIPADFDTENFLRQAKVQFIRLQAVFDAGDLTDLASFTTPEVFAELKLDINDRSGADNQTDVVQLDAEMLGVDEEGSDYYASVAFSGLIRESAEGTAEPFNEVWLLSKPRTGDSGWVLAGIEQGDKAGH